jgi:hypothetical protein
MKKALLFCLLFFLNFSISLAQTGIGTATPNASAKLEVYATNKGFLPPRIALTGTTDNSTIASPAAGLLIYNTATAGAAPNNVLPGFYYWNGSAWVQIAGGLVIDASKTSSFSLAAADNNKLFFISSASAVTVTVPTLPTGFSCQLIQTGAGTVTFAAGSGTTLNSASGLSTRTTNSVIGLVMNGTTVGYVFGDTIY